MALNNYFMNFTVFFRSASEYNAAVAFLGGHTTVRSAPNTAISVWGLPNPQTGDVCNLDKGIIYYPPYEPGTEFMYPGPTGLFVDPSVAFTFVPGQVGNPASIWGTPVDARFHWVANLVLMSGAGRCTTDTPINPISQRRFIAGRELSEGLEGGSSITNQAINYSASRVFGGQGFPYNNATINAWQQDVNQYRTALTPSTSWDRFYFRVRVLPTAGALGMYKCKGIGVTNGGSIRINTSGIMEAFNIANTGTETSQGTFFTPVLNTWYRCDVLLRFGSNNGRMRIFINGVQQLSFQITTTTGMGANLTHATSLLGRYAGSAEPTAEIDYDDWVNADIPANVNATTLAFNDTNYPIDWLLGSHIRLHSSKSVTQTNWTPAAIGQGVVNQFIDAPNRLATSDLQSSTAAAQIVGLTDVPALDADQIDTLGVNIGAAAALVSYSGKTADSSDGSIGYKLAGGADTLTSINQTNTENQFVTAYLPTGMIMPTDIAPWSVVHQKSAGAGLDTTSLLATVVEYLGVWGPEDDPTFDPPTARLDNLHNCRYPNTIWGYFGAQPMAPVYAIGGTYVGNGTYQEITVPGPLHFLMIRNTAAAGGGGIKFFACSQGGHQGDADQPFPNVRMFYDPVSATYKFSLSGTSANFNQNAVVYQYIAFSDPGMRYNLCMSSMHGGTGGATSNANALIDPTFLAEFGFAMIDVIGGTPNSGSIFTRGPGSTSNSGSLLGGGALNNNIMNFSAGVLTNFSGLQGTNTFNCSLWRTQDTGGLGCATSPMVQILQYTGNGTNPRTITLTPTSGRFPLFVLVSPVSNTNSIMRDPSHTGTNSCNAASHANTTTGITGVGVDQITVNSSLNVNLTVYNVFVICGDTAAMNNGNFTPIICGGVAGGIYEDPIDLPDPTHHLSIVGEGGLELDGQPARSLLQSISGIYTLVAGARHDTLIDRQAGQTSVNVPIPNPRFKTGYIGG